MKKTAALATSILLVGLGASACGGGASSAPTDASKEKFCSNFENIPDDASGNEAADVLKEVGTPDDISEDARKGFELLIDKADDFDNLDNVDEAALKDEFGEDGARQFLAFFQYFATKCMGAEMQELQDQMDQLEDLQDEMGDLPTGLPTE